MITDTYHPKAQVNYPYEISGYPRFCEAARYWMQWAGIPDSVYSDSHGKNDYTDDYKSRGIWVNYLAGGSAANPTEKGLNIPVDIIMVHMQTVPHDMPHVIYVIWYNQIS